jgi:hypothetical protein
MNYVKSYRELEVYKLSRLLSNNLRHNIGSKFPMNVSMQMTS